MVKSSTPAMLVLIAELVELLAAVELDVTYDGKNDSVTGSVMATCVLVIAVKRTGKLELAAAAVVTDDVFLQSYSHVVAQKSWYLRLPNMLSPHSRPATANTVLQSIWSGSHTTVCMPDFWVNSVGGSEAAITVDVGVVSVVVVVDVMGGSITGATLSARGRVVDTGIVVGAGKVMATGAVVVAIKGMGKIVLATVAVVTDDASLQSYLQVVAQKTWYLRLPNRMSPHSRPATANTVLQSIWSGAHTKVCLLDVWVNVVGGSVVVDVAVVSVAVVVAEVVVVVVVALVVAAYVVVGVNTGQAPHKTGHNCRSRVPAVLL